MLKNSEKKAHHVTAIVGKSANPTMTEADMFQTDGVCPV